jgi:hypothetical protein
MSEKKTTYEGSKFAAESNAGAAALTIISIILTLALGINLSIFGIHLVSMWMPLTSEIFCLMLAVGTAFALWAAVLSKKRKRWTRAIGITAIGFLLAGNIFSLLALVFLLSSKREFTSGG